MRFESGPVGKDLGIELKPTCSLFVAAGRARVVRHRLNQPVGDVKFPILATPKMVMRQFMTDDGLEFLGVEQREHRAGKYDMTFARNEVERGIELRTVLRLI